MAATLTIADDEDGTGATATVAGGGAGAANVVTVYKATGRVGSMVGTAYTRTGNGTLSLPVARGLWFALLTTDGVPAGMVYFAATSGLDAVATRVRRAVADTIRLLNIPPAERVYEQMIPDESNVSFPCVLVTVDGVQESQETGLSTVDDIGRPVKVAIADRGGKREAQKLAEYEYWRQSIDRCFRSQQLAGIPESVICRIEPNLIIDPNLPQYDYIVTGLVVRAVCREPRGVGV